MSEFSIQPENMTQSATEASDAFLTQQLDATEATSLPAWLTPDTLQSLATLSAGWLGGLAVTKFALSFLRRGPQTQENQT